MVTYLYRGLVLVQLFYIQNVARVKLPSHDYHDAKSTVIEDLSMLNTPGVLFKVLFLLSHS